ncbi:1,3-beta-galactosyl-N-acetylhexosamine phosphorylase [Neoactinobaculum massilliense]|uniref:1,3-beta-galactosyl-N-acetylhexosamine phosphorylase n=1 Tax=Neoactinobaculum massilliense TaxID=2364794 RepID=UPI000F52B7CE|nr:1,3-beta-galactosyl-N-acetylhexosamine phosphorylase [Neoactinobaculum massilliense]
MRGRLTIPTDLDVVPETLELMKRWGADAIRDCDGAEFPKELRGVDAKIYKTYYTTRKDNEWAKANPDEVQQSYIMTAFHTATEEPLAIPLMKGISPELMKPNTHDDIKRWWEVVDRTTGEPLDPAEWEYRAEDGVVVIPKPAPYHEYTVSFLAYLIWDPVHMYNAVVNNWTGVEHQITFDVRQPKTHAWSLKRLRKFIEDNPHVDVLRFTTFFHQFTLVFDELRREKYVDWYGYSSSVSPYILDQFESEVGYRFRPEFIIDQGYYNNQYRVPSKEYQDFQAFQRREVAKLVREMTDICHEYGKEAMMFLGDHWIGTEPYMEEFRQSGVDAIVGSVGNGSTLRLISDIKGVKYTEGRFLPYFFPDSFYKGADPVKEARENWVTARRAILRSPIDRIGYGGYLKLAYEFPDFVAYVESVAGEFRELYANIKGAKPFSFKRVAVLNSWGKMRSWGAHMVHHALYQKQNYSYAGVIEALSGAPFDVRFISFDDVVASPSALEDVDVIINVGDADTAHTGGAVWEDPAVSSAIKRFVHNGGGLIGVGEPGGHQYQGRFLQLAAPLGVEKETGFTLNYDKYNWEEHRDHFILADCQGGDGSDTTVGASAAGADGGAGAVGDFGPQVVAGGVNFGEGKKSIYALEGTDVLIQKDREVQMAANQYGRGRGVYISGLPYSALNSRVLYRAILWAAGAENELHTWFSTNVNVEVHAYLESGKYCVVNNTYEPQSTTVYRGDGSSFPLDLDASEIRWFGI